MAMIVIPRRIPWRRKANRDYQVSPNIPKRENLLTFVNFDSHLGVLDALSASTQDLVNGAALTSGPEGLEYDFTSTKYARTIKSHNLSNGYTIAIRGIWLSFPVDWAGVVAIVQNNDPQGVGIQRESGGTTIRIYHNDSPVSLTGVTTTNLADSVYKTLYVTWNASNDALKVYYGKTIKDDIANSVVPNGTTNNARWASARSSPFEVSGRYVWAAVWNAPLSQADIDIIEDNQPGIFYAPRTQLIFIPSGGALSLSSAATLRDGDKPIATQQKAVSVDALIRAADLLIGTPQKSLSVDALLADADKLSTASRHEATLATQLLDGDVSIASAQKAGSISGLLQDADKATGAGSKAALVTGLLLDGDLLTALGSQIETHQSAGMLSGADVLIAGVTTNRTTSGKAQDGDTLTVASAIDRLSAALGIDPETLNIASTSARSIGALIVEGDAAVAGIQSGRLQPALLIDGDILIITSSTIAQADLAGRINLSGRYAPQVSLVGVYAPAINLKGRVH